MSPLVSLPPAEFAADTEGLDEKLAASPDRPAVFLVWPREGAPYLGRTGVLRRRLKRLLGLRDKPSRLLNLRAVATRVQYWVTGSRLESSLVFYQLALEHFPDTYLDLLNLRMPPYLKVILSNPFPRTQITVRLGGGRGLYYGPFRTRVAAEQFEAQALELFQVRRCQEDLEPSPEHPGCIYGEMNKCLRPCQQAVGEDEYRSEVSRLVTFLRTGGASLIEPLEAARDRLSTELRFEDAAREHRQIDRIREMLRARDDLASDIDSLNGVAVTPSAEPGVVQLWFLSAGCWHAPVRFGFDVVDGKTISIDQRLREAVSALGPSRATVQARQEHLALLGRWYYSSWRDGEWIPFSDFAHIPYRKLVRAVSRLAHDAQS